MLATVPDHYTVSQLVFEQDGVRRLYQDVYRAGDLNPNHVWRVFPRLQALADFHRTAVPDQAPGIELHQLSQYLCRQYQDVPWSRHIFDFATLWRMLPRLQALADVHPAAVPDAQFLEAEQQQLHEHNQRVRRLLQDLHARCHLHPDSLRRMFSRLQALADVHPASVPPVDSVMRHGRASRHWDCSNAQRDYCDDRL